MNTINKSNILVSLSYFWCGLSIIQVFANLLRLFFATSLPLHEKVPLKQLEIIVTPYLFVESILIFELFSLSSFEGFHKIRRKFFIRTCQKRLEMLLVLLNLLCLTLIHCLLPLVYLIYLDLGPNKATIFSEIFADWPPKSSLDESFDHIAVVSITDVKL